MTSVRLTTLAAVFVLALPAFSQQQVKDAAQRPADAVQNIKTDGGSHLTTLDADSDLSMVITPAGMDGACFTIRSIVVARDRKDSDATHFVRTSTCQPSSRYRLRTAEQTDSSGH
jgi:hypothetical protein